MHHPPLRRALLVEHPQDVVVGVAVVDDQRLVEPLGQVDVRAERLVLRGPAVLAGAEVVEPGLAHRPHLAWARPAARSRPARRRGPASQPRRLVGVQRDAGDERVVRRRGLDRPPRARQVAADLHDAGHARRRRPRRSPRRAGRSRVAVGDVEVAVVVHDRVGQRLGRGRPSGRGGRRGLLGGARRGSRVTSASARCTAS